MTTLRSSTNGANGLTQANADGDPVQGAGDEVGRAYVRPFANGAPISSANPLPVAPGAGVVTQVEGDIAQGAVEGNGNFPVSTGAIAASSVLGQTAAVAAGQRVKAAATLNGALITALGGGNRWTKFNSTLAVSATTFLATNAPAMVGRIGVTGDVGSVDMYALVFDGVDATGTLVDRFFVPAGGIAVMDYTTEGGLRVTVGCFVALTTDPGAVAAPAVGGFVHAIFQPT